MKRFVIVLSVILSAVPLLHSCRGMAEFGPDIVEASPVAPERPKSTRLVAGSSMDEFSPDTKSVVYNGMNHKDDINSVKDGHDYITNWLVVLYESDGSRVDFIGGFDESGNYLEYRYPAFHDSKNILDSNADSERYITTEHDSAPYGLGYVYNEDGTDYEYYKVYVIKNLPLDDISAVDNFCREHFPETVKDFGSFENNLSFHFGEFEYGGVSGYGSIGQVGETIRCGRSSDAFRFGSGDKLNYFSYFSKFILTINDVDRDILGRLNIKESKIHNIPKSINPFKSGVVKPDDVMYKPDVCSVSFQDILAESEKGNFYNRSIYFLLPNSYPGESNSVTCSSERSLVHLSDNGEEELGNSAIFVEAEFDLKNSWRFNNEGSMILRGYPQTEGKGVSDFNIYANANSSLTWNVTYDYIKNSDPWLVELHSDEASMTARWSEDWYMTQNSVALIGENDIISAELSNYLCDFSDIIVRVESSYGDYSESAKMSEVNSVLSEFAGVFELYDDGDECLYVRISDYSLYEASAYFDVEDAFFTIEFEDPVSKDKCKLKFSGDLYQDGPALSEDSSLLYVGQKRLLDAGEPCTWSIVSGPASLSSSSGKTNYLNCLGPGKVTLRLSASDNSVSVYTFTIYEPSLQVRFDGGNWKTVNTTSVNTPEFFVDDSSRCLEYRYVDSKGNVLTFDSSLYNSQLRLSFSGNNSYGVSNGYITWNRTNSSSAYNGGAYDKFTINVNMLEKNNGAQNIFWYLGQTYAGSANNNDLFSIILQPPYYSSYSSASSVRPFKWVANMIHPLADYFVSGFAGDYVGLPVELIYNTYYVYKSETISGSQCVPVRLANRGLHVKCRDISHLRINLTGNGTYSSMFTGQVSHHDSHAEYGGFYLDNFKIAVNASTKGAYYVGFYFTNGNRDLYLFNRCDSQGMSNFSTRVKLVMGVDMCMGFEDEHDRTLLFAPCYRNANDDSISPRTKIGPVMFTDSKGVYDVSQMKDRFQGPAYSVHSKTFSMNAVSGLTNGCGLAFYKLAKDYKWYAAMLGFREIHSVYINDKAFSIINYDTGDVFSQEIAGGSIISRMIVSGADCNIYFGGQNGFLYYYSFYHFYNCFVFDTSLVTRKGTLDEYPMYQLDSDQDIVIVDYRPELNVIYHDTYNF